MGMQEEWIRKGYCNPVFLGRGGFSEVWRLQKQETGHYFACKVSRESGQARQEALLLSCLEHPLFPHYYEHWQKEGVQYLLMEYVPGNNLKTLLQRRGGLTQKTAVRIALELADGLLYLHERGDAILFRDLKPDNVLLRQDGRVKLVDMGCACTMQEGAKRSLAGSRGYSAPEQFTWQAVPGAESDVYALGKLLQCMLTGGMPDGGESIKLRKGSRGLNSLIQSTTQREAQERIADMREFRRQLSRYQQAGIREGKGSWDSSFKRNRDGGEYYYESKVYRGV